MIPAPPIDRRTAVDVAEQLRTLLQIYAPGWKGGPGEFGDALVAIFARFAEIVIERLNRTPDKNLLAYLDLLGLALQPPQPARVPLTFSLAAGSASDGLVPAATQVAAPPAAGETTPLIFETERELVVIAAKLDKVFAVDPGSDSFADLSEFAIAPGAGAARAFTRSMPIDDSLYLGFTLPVNRSFPNRPVALYFAIAGPEPETPPDNPSPAGPSRLVWECSEGAGAWRPPGLRDGTRGLTRSGVVEFLAPATFALQQEFEAERYWLRCRWDAGSFAFHPRLQRVLLNTVMATHATTILDETLGSSDGSPNQRYVTARRPVLHDQEELRVREPDLPSVDERAALQAPEGDDAITVTLAAGGRPAEIWVRWQEVTDFYGSGPRDRHYVLDHLAGTVSFGDGVNGLVPPLGVGNLRLARYRTGGGSAGNCAAGTIVQLRTTIPYVDSVTNLEAARGGVDAETMDSLRERGPRAIRHGGRAVTIEDYEDLALLASPEVARAKCVPLYDLSADIKAASKRAGVVSVIVVPRSTEAKPLPSRVLLERVAGHLDARRLPVVDLRVVGPDYVQVDIKAEVALTSIDRAAEVQPHIVATLRSFLHPLTGGFDGTGWDFGRLPHRSDLLRRIGEIAGVDHVRSLKVEPPEREPPKRQAADKPWALLYAGTLDITVVAANA